MTFLKYLKTFKIILDNIKYRCYNKNMETRNKQNQIRQIMSNKTDQI